MMSSRQAIDEANYHNDHRVIARERGPVKGFDEKAMTITHVVEECSCDKCEAKMPPYATMPAYCVLQEGRRNMSAMGWYVTGPGDLQEYFSCNQTVWQLPNGRYCFMDMNAELSGQLPAERRRDELNLAVGFPPDWSPEPHVLVLRACYEVCGTCDGRGSHVNPDIDAGGISGDDPFWEDDRDDDWDYCDDDDDGHRQTSRYMRGDYDVSCYECHGKRVVPVPREDNDPADLAIWRELRQGDAAYAAECRAERMMGA